MYWTLQQYKETREKINPVSKWWGKKSITEKDSRPLICQCIDSMVKSLISQVGEIDLDDLGFADF